MATPPELVDGWTEVVDFQLKSDGVVVNLTGGTVELILKGNDGIAVDTAGNTSILDAVNGKVRYIPDAADLVATKSPYSARWKVTLSSRISFFPNGGADEWIVRAP